MKNLESKFFAPFCFGMLLLMVLASYPLAIKGSDSTVVGHTLMPVPAKVDFGNGRLRLSKDFKIAFAGAPDDRVKNYAWRVVRRIEGRTVMELARDFSTDPSTAALIIDVGTRSNKFPKLKEDESYKLVVTDKKAHLRSKTSLGAMRGLETLLQLLSSDKSGAFFPVVSIEDKPRFPWRGLMIDSARHFQPMEVLKRNIDGMAAMKLNVFHWHLTEDQGIRVESKKFPKLHGMGSDGLFYTQKQIKEIIEYAADRGIRVVPEFDMPGHATAWLVGYPELASAPGPYTIERDPGIFDPTLNPIKETTYEFLAVFLAEMAGLFPDAYIHIGGDENEGKHWDANAEIQAFMKEKGIKDNHELQTYFNKRILKILKKHGKTMMGWDEIFQPDLPKDVVVHSWRGQKALAESARQGYFGVLSNGYYIDLLHPASSHYVVDPIPEDSTLTAEEKKRILGGEATMWSEWVSPETIDSRIWPRTAAIAERFWSDGSVKDVDDMYRRLETVSIQLEELGLTHRRNRAMMLRRLLQSADISDLETLVSIIEPVKQYRRYQQRKQTMLSPLTGLIDAAGADAKGAREFRKIAKEFSKGNSKEVVARLEGIFMGWRYAGIRLKPQMEVNASLHEAKALARELQKLGEIGLNVLKIKWTEAETEDWRKDTLAELDRIAKPKPSAVEFVVIEDLKGMINSTN